MENKMNKDIPSELKECIQFHGHLCPDLVIGYTAANIGLARLKHKRARYEELVCIAMTDSCAVDAIQCMTGCTLGKGNLILQDFGKMVFIFAQRKRGGVSSAVRLALNPKALKTRLGSAKREDKEAVAIDLLRISPEKLFKLTLVHKYSVPERARIFPSRLCTRCNELTMEPRLKVENGELICMECARYR